MKFYKVTWIDGNEEEHEDFLTSDSREQAAECINKLFNPQAVVEVEKLSVRK